MKLQHAVLKGICCFINKGLKPHFKEVPMDVWKARLSKKKKKT